MQHWVSKSGAWGDTKKFCMCNSTHCIREGATGMNQAFRTYPKVRAMKQQEAELMEDDS